MLRYGMACASMILAAGLVVAQASEKVVPANKASPLRPLFSISYQSCDTRAFHNPKVAGQPRHGTAAIVEVTMTLPKDFVRQCAGKRVKVPWLVYKPAANYRGPDLVAFTYYWSRFVGEPETTFVSSDVCVMVE